uniref:Uncharacterized protein n=1 Tax=Cucumis melo TaxID=3656 RepID=A0A9I9ED52_CUCME
MKPEKSKLITLSLEIVNVNTVLNVWYVIYIDSVFNYCNVPKFKIKMIGLERERNLSLKRRFDDLGNINHLVQPNLKIPNFFSSINSPPPPLAP